MRKKNQTWKSWIPTNMVTNLRQLMSMGPWIREATDLNLRTLLERLCAEKTSIPIDDLIGIGPRVVGGSIQHRLADRTSCSGSMIHSMSNFSAYVQMVSDTAVQFAKSTRDFTICFQSVFLGVISRLSQI